jgi:photosystem II stability/assembly factor-like uncharacterized protein
MRIEAPKGRHRRHTKEEELMKSAKPCLASLPALIGALLWLSRVPAEAGENIWTTNGPSGPVQILASDPTASGTIYAASNPGGLEIAPTLFRSVDGGATWEPLATGDLSQSTVTCMAVDASRPASVYAGITRYVDGLPTGRFLKSRDGGAHWENGPIASRSFSSTSIAVDAGTGSIYLGQNADFEPSIAPVLRSSDGGSTWTETSLSKPHFTYTLLSDSLNRTLLVGTDFSYISPWYTVGLGGNVARTADGGATWSLSPMDLGSAVVALAKNAQSTAYYAGTSVGALYESLDGGANWAPLATLPGPVAALAVDPADSSVFYAAVSHRGVLRSTDGGASWRSFNSGISTRVVTSLTIDSTGRVLHVGTDQGVFNLEIAPSPEPAPCTPGADHLCFFGSRFRADLTAVDPFTRTPLAANAVPGNSRSGYFTFPSLTGDATFPEVVVKMVDATSLPGSGYWVYYAGMTSLLYTLKITDTTTGVAREYSGEDSCGGADVSGFLPGATPENAVSTSTAIAPQPTGSQPDLTLLGGRFRVTLTARNPVTETIAAGVAIPQGDRFGSFSIPDFTGDPGLPEVFVKMIDAGGGSFLFFYTGLTSLDYAVTVFDEVTETERTYAKETTDPKRPCGGAELLMFGK